MPKGEHKAKPKKGKKKSKTILEQMEFYFSDSNLRRDRFLREKITECVPLDVQIEEQETPDKRLGLELSLFLNFNNIKALTGDVTVIKEALVNSTLLSVYQRTATDPPEWIVGRKDWSETSDLTEFLAGLDGNNQEFDKRTIYCENLPINASQKWLRDLFSQFGKINLVSVPKFKGNQRIKQFCFVEFAEESALPVVLDYFKQFQGVLCYDETESDHLQSIQKFHEENKQEDSESQAKKRKKNPPSVAKGKVDKNKDGEDDNDDEDDDEEDPDATEAEKSVSPELNDNMIYDLKIMPKVEWKRLRNKYLNLQREMVREMKKQAYFRRMQSGQGHGQINNNIPAAHPKIKQKAIIESTDPPAEGDAEEGAGKQEDGNKSKRRKRGREKIKEAIKKSSHIFFDS